MSQLQGKRPRRRWLRVAVCGCELMKRYRGKLHGEQVVVHGQPLSVYQGRVSEFRHDTELRKRHRRHHVFFDADYSGCWVETWDLGTNNEPCHSIFIERWQGYPTVPEVLHGIAVVIEKKFDKDELDAWLKRMRPAKKKRVR